MDRSYSGGLQSINIAGGRARRGRRKASDGLGWTSAERVLNITTLKAYDLRALCMREGVISEDLARFIGASPSFRVRGLCIRWAILHISLVISHFRYEFFGRHSTFDKVENQELQAW